MSATTSEFTTDQRDFPKGRAATNAASSATRATQLVPGKAPADRPSQVASATKTHAILKLLRRKKGASIEEMQKATGWQAHSVRGFLSAAVRKRMGLPLKSAAGPDGARRYTIVVA